MTRTNEQELSASYQNKVGDLVGREIGHCVSCLVSDLLKIYKYQYPFPSRAHLNADKAAEIHLYQCVGLYFSHDT